MLVDDTILDYIPTGFIPLKDATTAPPGTQWYYNGKSLFDEEFEAVLVKDQQNE